MESLKYLTILFATTTFFFFVIVIVLLTKDKIPCRCRRRRTKVREPVKLNTRCETNIPIDDETIAKLIEMKDKKDISPSSSQTGNEYSKLQKRPSRFKQEFHVIERIGKGAYGTVYKATNRSDGAIYAVKKIKIPRDEDADKALREVKALNCDHTSIVRYHQSWTEESHTFSKNNEADYIYASSAQYLYIQMQYCPDGTLRKWIQNRNELLTSEVLDKTQEMDCKEVFGQITCAIEYLHSHNFMHRDLTPYNIFLIGKCIKVGDLGLAKFIRTNTDQESSHSHSAKVGAPLYRAPEQNTTKYDYKVDIFSMGMILFELLYPTKTAHEHCCILKDVRSRIFPKNFTPTELMKQMLSEDPEERPSASDVAKSDFLKTFWSLRQERRLSSITNRNDCRANASNSGNIEEVTSSSSSSF